MTPTKKGEASANPRKDSTAATNKKAAGGKRKPRTTGKTSTAATKPSAASKPVAKKTAAKPAAEQAAAKPPAAKTVAKEKPAWEPQVIVFACNWCSYAGADTAGVSRIQQQPNFRMIRVMCSGRIQPAFVLRAFEKGADGVLVSGCHFGDCHYIFGNERAAEQFEKTKNMVKLLGIEEGRLRLEWISAAEGARFAQVINEFTDQVRDLGPIPFSNSQPIEQTEDVA
jgi:F420-non-reducing hydrogenase iron-sulfur subunit